MMLPSWPRLSVSATGTAGMAPGWVARACTSASITPAGIHGRAASCTITISGAAETRASSPARTLSWRVAPPGTIGRCESPARAASISTLSPTGWMRTPARASASAACRITGCPAMWRNCLGRSAPKREPLPAATRRAAILGISVMVAHPAVTVAPRQSLQPP